MDNFMPGSRREKISPDTDRRKHMIDNSQSINY